MPLWRSLKLSTERVSYTEQVKEERLCLSLNFFRLLFVPVNFAPHRIKRLLFLPNIKQKDASHRITLSGYQHPFHHHTLNPICYFEGVLHQVSSIITAGITALEQRLSEKSGGQ